MQTRIAVLAMVAALAIGPSQTFAQGAVGNAVIRSNVANGDTLIVALSGVSSAPAGSHFQGWLRSSDGSQRTDLGVVPVGQDGSVSFTYLSPRSENLLGANSVFELSVEPDNDADAGPSGVVAYRGQLNDALLPAVRELLVRWPNSRFGSPSGPGLLAHARLLDATSQQLQDAADAGDVGLAKRLAERIVNAVEGQGGEHFADHNGDGLTEGPGDGTGVLNYAWGTYWRAKVARDAAAGDSRVAGRADAIAGSVELQIVSRLAELRDQGLELQRADDPADIQARALLLRDAASRALHGFDADGDGAVQVATGEGGAEQVLDESQQLAAFQVGPA
jgi:hypothetical protein